VLSIFDLELSLILGLSRGDQRRPEGFMITKLIRDTLRVLSNAAMTIWAKTITSLSRLHFLLHELQVFYAVPLTDGCRSPAYAKSCYNTAAASGSIKINLVQSKLRL
jgi:hypothetical protein